MAENPLASTTTWLSRVSFFPLSKLFAKTPTMNPFLIRGSIARVDSIRVDPESIASLSNLCPK